MNDKRRSKLRSVVSSLNSIQSTLESVLDQENDCLDNIPENLEGSDMYNKIQLAVDNLEDAIDGIGEVVRSVQDAAV